MHFLNFSNYNKGKNMPNWRAHNKINFVMYFICLAIILIFFHRLEKIISPALNILLLIFTASYIFSNYFLSPDLDLKKNECKKNWGIFGFIWVPYTSVFKHRGISHSIIFGPLTRIIYLLLIILLPLIVLKKIGILNIDISINLDSFGWKVLITVIIGIYLPCLFHTLADRIFHG
ncbi:MAG: hypothetical protein DRH57_00365 [Candidatus Cloacimonadota bacterium]|nr:MAG: hypothetical protein DRH57_00365 [Candidatus Cloacimonadota bacterium]